ncbi:MAG TPA: S1 RNA-binding domain-containing protein, partial [Sedimenticola sp.]|nr:S1 RNA-binding domain-containing protein [Sedimenticola sp.]
MTENEDFAALLQQYDQEHGEPARHAPQVGDKVEGRVVSITGNSIYVDLGGKSEGILEADEYTDETGNLILKVGDPVSTVVTGKD